MIIHQYLLNILCVLTLVLGAYSREIDTYINILNKVLYCILPATWITTYVSLSILYIICSRKKQAIWWVTKIQNKKRCWNGSPILTKLKFPSLQYQSKKTTGQQCSLVPQRQYDKTERHNVTSQRDPSSSPPLQLLATQPWASYLISLNLFPHL